jgi:hypothetical protein
VDSVPSDISLRAIFDATDVRVWMPKEENNKYSISRDKTQLMIIIFIFFDILY